MKDLEPANNYLFASHWLPGDNIANSARRGAAPFLGRRGLQAGLKCPAERRKRP